MSYFPDARTGENGYKDADLKGERAAFLRGFDCAVDEMMALLKGNLDIYTSESIIVHYMEKHSEEAEEFIECVKAWLEMSRNEAAVCLLDEQYMEEEDMADVK